jgi:hypothetical protein
MSGQRVGRLMYRAESARFLASRDGRAVMRNDLKSLTMVGLPRSVRDEVSVGFQHAA